MIQGSQPTDPQFYNNFTSHSTEPARTSNQYYAPQ